MRLFWLLCAFPLAACAAPVSVVPTEDAKAVLHNPDMGWVLYENYPVDPHPGGSNTLLALPDEKFDPVDAVAIMFSWQDIEKVENEYDFSRADFAYDYWKRRGKQIHLRVSTESLLWWSNRSPPAGKGVPDYVLQKLPADRKQVRKESGLDYDVVDAREPYYLARLEQFLTAVAAHFSGDHAVTLVDLRGFGLWGEWHSGYRYATLDDRRAALIGVIDLYSRCFKDNYVALSYSYDPDGAKELRAGPTNRFDPAFTSHYEEFLRFSAFDHALKVKNVTFRRDGAGGAVHSNERKLCDEAFKTFHKAPLFCEFVDGYAQSKKGKKGWVEWKIEDALSLHPNYINLLGWQGGDARDFMKERADLIEHGLRTMGYRLVPTRFQFPPTIRSGTAFQCASTWLNRGTGRPLRDYHLHFTLGQSTTDTGPTGCDQWIQGQSYDLKSEVTIQDVPPGQYTLRFAIFDPATKKAIGLPLTDGDDNKTYKLGLVTVVQ